jgi:transposase
LTKALTMSTERLGPLPLVNHFVDRLGLPRLLERFVPTDDRRVRLPFARALGVLLRSLVVEREPIYRQQETVSTFAPGTFGLAAHEIELVGDDAIGRALDRLFDADRAGLLTEIVLAAGHGFGVSFDELHNDSTSVRFCGQYRQARGRRMRGRRAPFITYGYSKDHRPDLKQLLFILTTTRDGAVPIQFRCAAGNESDSRTHADTWDALCRVAGRTDFLYVADSKLCSRDAMDHIHDGKGRFVCVMPRSRSEDSEFREWIQTHAPEWTLVWDRQHPRRRKGPRDRWSVFRYPLPSREGWPVVWAHSSLLALRQEQTRRENLTRAVQDLEQLNARLAGPRPRNRLRREVEQRVGEILDACKVRRYLKVVVSQAAEHRYRQAKAGRPGPNTQYVRRTRRYWRLAWELDQAAVDYDLKSDGMYPLLTNDRSLTDAEVLEAHKRQPAIEKRFEQTKTVMEIAPVLLKNEGRVEALFFLYFVALLVQALIERQLRLAMKNEDIEELPLYPEERTTKRPTTDQILRLFSLVQRNVLFYRDLEVKTFEPELTDLQRRVLQLLGVAVGAYARRA